MTYRNKKLLNYAKEAPECFCCYRANDGTVIAAHSNQIRDGKGTGIKAHDYRVAYICSGCHQLIDGGNGSKIAKRELWEDAHRATIGWLFESGFIHG